MIVLPTELRPSASGPALEVGVLFRFLAMRKEKHVCEREEVSVEARYAFRVSR